MVNVKDKTCLKCKAQPAFNVEGEKQGIYCGKHKLAGMVNVISKTCLECKAIPVFNVEGKKQGIYCGTHKLPGMVNVVSKTCKTHMCSVQVGKKYEGYCVRCFMYTFPDKPISRNYKTKETTVVHFIKSQFTMDWVADKRVVDGCSKRRPDLLVDLGYQVIIAEIDENQHIDYDCSCENKRIMELSQDFGHRPIVFIRFNPDDYLDGGKNITSCWGLDKKGLAVVKKSKTDEWATRMKALRDEIEYWTMNTTEKTVEIVQLFYDR